VNGSCKSKPERENVFIAEKKKNIFLLQSE